MTRKHTTEFVVEWGDCDPAGIVFYPNFLRWMDASGHDYFAAAGVPLWFETEAKYGIVGTPIVDLAVQFRRPATYGDRISVETTVTGWRRTSFTMTHVVRRGDDVLVEGREVRIFARRHPDDPRRIQAVPPPAELKGLLE